MKRKARKEKTDSIDVWPIVVVIAGILLILSLGFNIYYAISLSQDKRVASSNNVKGEAYEEIDPSSGIDESEDVPIDEDFYDEEDESEDTEIMTNKERELLNIIENKRKELGQNDWKCTNVYLDAKNAEGTKYFVYYTAEDDSGDEEEFVTLIERKNGKWEMQLPGYDMADEMLYQIYGLKMID